MAPEVVYARIGAYLGLLGPLAFYWMLLQLAGRRAALLGVIGMVFVVGRELWTPYAASYSPWLTSNNLTQEIFYLGIGWHARALRSGRASAHHVCGGLLGLAFLGHTFPALVLGLLIALTVLRPLATTTKSAGRSVTPGNARPVSRRRLRDRDLRSSRGAILRVLYPEAGRSHAPAAGGRDPHAPGSKPPSSRRL